MYSAKWCITVKCLGAAGAVARAVRSPSSAPNPLFFLLSSFLPSLHLDLCTLSLGVALCATLHSRSRSLSKPLSILDDKRESLEASPYPHAHPRIDDLRKCHLLKETQGMSSTWSGPTRGCQQSERAVLRNNCALHS